MVSARVRSRAARRAGCRSLAFSFQPHQRRLALTSRRCRPGNLLFFSGMLPVVDHKPKYVGRLGKELDAEAGRDAAYTAALSGLAAAKKHLGSLDRVTRVVRLGVFIATSGISSISPESRTLCLTCFATFSAARRLRCG